MLTIVKWIGGPGSWGFFVIVSLVGCALARTRLRAAAVVLVSLTALYVVLSLPVVATALSNSLGAYQPLSPVAAELSGGGATLVVLGGDNGLGRDREARRLCAALRPARAVIFGDPGIARTILQTGVSPDRMVEGGDAGTTRDQIASIARLPRLPGDRLVVVASRLQMPRVIRLARANRLEIVPAASDVDTPIPSAGLRRWWPSLAALRVSRDAVYEHGALTYYTWRGWLT